MLTVRSKIRAFLSVNILEHRTRGAARRAWVHCGVDGQATLPGRPGNANTVRPMKLAVAGS